MSSIGINSQSELPRVILYTYSWYCNNVLTIHQFTQRCPLLTLFLLLFYCFLFFNFQFFYNLIFYSCNFYLYGAPGTKQFPPGDQYSFPDSDSEDKGLNVAFGLNPALVNVLLCVWLHPCLSKFLVMFLHMCVPSISPFLCRFTIWMGTRNGWKRTSVLCWVSCTLFRH